MDHRRIRPLTAALLALVLLLGLGACEQNSSPYAVEEAVYHQGKPSAQVETLGSFFPKSAQAFLAGTQTENRVYSPLNIFLALAMLAETTGGETRQEVLSLLGCTDLEALRTLSGDLWRANQQDSKHITVTLASSLWMNDWAEYVPETIRTISRVHHASTFQGTMGDKDYDQALREWIDQQTGGCLTDQSVGLEMPEEGLLVLVSTLFFRGEWEEPFYKEATAPDTFHSPGGDLRCDFMNQLSTLPYAQGDSFSAMGLKITKGGTMWFILPEEGGSIDTLLADPELYAFLDAGTAWESYQESYAVLSLPKFDLSSDLSLQEGLQALGVTKAFDPALADFSPAIVSPAEEVYLSKAQHAARVMVDEAGCLAAAYTEMGAAATGDHKFIEFTLNQPFLFVLTNQDGLPLFMGVVNAPG